MGYGQYCHFGGHSAGGKYAGKEEPVGRRSGKEAIRLSLIVDIEKKLGNFTLRSQFETPDGIMALLGASGCGKSVTLKCIADGLMARIHANYRFIISFNTGLIVLGVAGVLPP